MKPHRLTRRSFLQESITLGAPVVLAANALPLAVGGVQTAALRGLKVICVGAHPDDPESGCGGTLLRYAEAGHSVAIVYLTRGERGIRDKSLAEAARIRS